MNLQQLGSDQQLSVATNMAHHGTDEAPPQQDDTAAASSVVPTQQHAEDTSDEDEAPGLLQVRTAVNTTSHINTEQGYMLLRDDQLSTSHTNGAGDMINDGPSTSSSDIDAGSYSDEDVWHALDMQPRSTQPTAPHVLPAPPQPPPGVPPESLATRAAAMDMTDERRSAILGAMKNISIAYTPRWAPVVSDEALVASLTAAPPQPTNNDDIAP